MRIMKGSRLFLVGLFLAVLALSPEAYASESDEASAAQAEDADKKYPTLAERIPSVTRRTFEKSGRLQMTPAVGIVFSDPFLTEYAPSLTFTYHMAESLAISLAGDYYVSSIKEIAIGGLGRPDDPDYNQPIWGARAGVAWSPIYGKISLLAEQVVHFDMYLAAGAGILGATRQDPSVAFDVAWGQNFFIGQGMALRFELRDQIFNMARNPDVSDELDMQHFLSFSIGLGFFIPSTFERESL